MRATVFAVVLFVCKGENQMKIKCMYYEKSLICDTYNNRINAKQVIDKYYKPDSTMSTQITRPKTCKKN